MLNVSETKVYWAMRDLFQSQHSLYRPVANVDIIELVQCLHTDWPVHNWSVQLLAWKATVFYNIRK